MRFVYSLVRFVPDPARGEFVNVGAIVGSEESSEWAIRQIENPIRVRALGAPLALDAVWSFIGRVGDEIDTYEESLESLFEAETDLSEDWLDRLHNDHRNVVQLSPPTPTVAETAEKALDQVFDLMIVDPTQRRYPFRKKNEALGALRRAYKDKSLRKNQDLQERVELSTDHHHDRFDFAVTNGRVLQLTHAWSFQVPDQESLSKQIKSWGWTVNDALRSGGSIRTKNGERFDVTTRVAVEVVYVPPGDGQDSPALKEARNVFHSLQITPVRVENASQVAHRASQLLVEARAI